MSVKTETPYTEKAGNDVFFRRMTNRISFIRSKNTFARVLPALVAVLCALPAVGVTLQTSEGETFEGDIRCTTGSRVFLVNSESAVNIIKKSTLVDGSVAEVGSWEAANAGWSQVPVKYDTMPTTVYRVAPDRDAIGDARNQVVMIALLLNEDGTVHSAYVKDSSDTRLNAPTIEAVSRWKFTPAMVANAPTRTVLSVPVQF